jgi:hypothetical protein
MGGTNSQPLGIILGVGREEGLERVVPGDDEAGKVSEQLATEVEDDEEEVERRDADGSVGLGDASLLLDVVQGGVLGELGQGRGQRANAHTKKRKAAGSFVIYLPPYRWRRDSSAPSPVRTTF